MQKKLLEVLICPQCLPYEYPLKVTVREEEAEDILSGDLSCPVCARKYPIKDGVAFLDPRTLNPGFVSDRYESETLLASYLWSHYGDLMADPEASTAYREWGKLLPKGSGWGVDIGAAVGRFSCEMSRTCDFVIGIDTSASFISSARRLLRDRTFSVNLPEEGRLCRAVTFNLPPTWSSKTIELVVADAQALPFKADLFSQVASLNLVDKLPRPLLHLTEVNRVARCQEAHFLFSDPFSWSTEAAPEKEWLGGTEMGDFRGYAKDNLNRLLSDPKGLLQPAWRIAGEGSVWWKIRTHRNHYELIRSCYLQAER